MLLPTSLVGSYPQPDWLIDREKLSKQVPRVRAHDLWLVDDKRLESAQDDATILAIRDQERAGLDIISDGEQRRESYSNRFATALEGVDIDNPGTTINRSGKPIPVPRVTGKIRRKHAIETRDVKILRANTDRRIKATVPGPFTMAKQAQDDFYRDEEAIAMDYAAAVNEEIKDLFAAGADIVQLDEPWMQQHPDKARQYGLKVLDRALQGVQGTIAVHLCFGYAAVVHDKPTGYSFLAELEGSKAQQISIEAAQPRLDLKVLKQLPSKTIILGVIDLSDMKVETPQIVADRIRAGLAHVPAERIVVAPDCGMKYLPRGIAFGKMKAMVDGAAIVRNELRRLKPPFVMSRVPPFRADHVGSLLRPAALKEARARRERGEISNDRLKAVEDREIEQAIRRQEAIGLQAVTDGEFRRAFWNYDFLGALPGVEAYLGDRKIRFRGPNPKPMMLRVTGKLGAFDDHPMIEHFRFVHDHTKATAKMTIPSPSSLHFRYGRDAVPDAIYPSMDDFYRDLGAAYRKAVRAFADAGCRYLQLDEVNFAYLCDPALRAQVAGRGDDPDKLPGIYARMINAAISDIAGDMIVTMHLCRGNFRSSFVASGGYEPVAEILFNEIGVHGYFMEYDTERAGGFEPLRLVPKGKKVVLGLVTSKTGALERKDDVKRRIHEAAKFVPLEQLALSPQCGFASTEEGNVLSENEQWAKLEIIVEVAREVWGDR